MYLIKQTSIFKLWLKRVKDPIAKVMMIKRIERAKSGNFGDHKLLANTGGIYEMRIDSGKGYRIYYAKIGEVIYLLTNGGNKKTQQQDIVEAQAILENFKRLEDNEND